MKSKGVEVAPSMHDFQGEDDARTIQRAEEVRADPKRHTAAKKHLRRTLRGVTRALGGRR